MTILDKVMFWKKKDEFSDIGLGDKDNLAFGDDFGAQPGAPGATPGAAPGAPPGLGPSPDLGPDPGLGAQPSAPPGPAPQPFQQPPPQVQQPSYNPQQDLEAKSLEVISSKLDALRASVDSLNQRLANLEAIARGDEDQGRRRRYY